MAKNEQKLVDQKMKAAGYIKRGKNDWVRFNHEPILGNALEHTDRIATSPCTETPLEMPAMNFEGQADSVNTGDDFEGEGPLSLPTMKF